MRDTDELTDKATCAICLLSETNCPTCGFLQYKHAQHTATVIDTRTCKDTDERKFVVADVMEYGAVLPHSVVLYYLDDKTLTADPRTTAEPYDVIPDDKTMPIIDMDKIEEIKF